MECNKYIYIVQSNQKFNEILEENYKKSSENNVIFTKIIDGEKCKNQKKLFREFSKVFNFPSYFSYNWDSFFECFTDLEWLGSKEEIVLFIKNFDCLLRNDEENYKTFMKILLDSVKEWRTLRDYNKSFIEPAINFTIFVQGSKRDLYSSDYIGLL